MGNNNGTGTGQGEIKKTNAKMTAYITGKEESEMGFGGF